MPSGSPTGGTSKSGSPHGNNGPLVTAASYLVSERDHPLDQLEQLESKARDLTAIGDHDKVIECRIKQLCLRKVLSHLHSFPQTDVIRAEIVLAEAYCQGGYFKQSKDHLAKAQEESTIGVFDDAQCQRLQVDLLLADGTLAHAEGREDASQKPLTEALRLCREAYGEMDIRSARAHVLLGRTAFKQRRHAEAIDFFSAAWQVHEAQSGGDSEETITMLLHIAEVQFADNQADLAIDTQLKAIEKLGKNGTLPGMLIESLIRLARWYESQGNDDEALQQWQAAERLVTENAGPEDPQAIEIKRDLALLHLKFGDHDVALQYLNDVHYFERRLHGSQSTGVARTLKALGTVHFVRHHFEDAERCFKQALHIFEAELPQTSAMVKDIQAKLRSMEAMAQEGVE